MNDYSGSLALQAGGVPIRRNWSALLGTVLAFFLILWIHGGNTSAKFQNVLLFTAYWIAPFFSVLAIDWYYMRARLTPGRLMELMDFRRLIKGWSAITALLVGFGCMVPFMNTGLIEGPVAKALDGADISFYVGFIVGALVYFPLRKIEARQTTEAFEPAVIDGTSTGSKIPESA
jgi:NCS1 family nucleobase:cation symporter-1